MECKKCGVELMILDRGPLLFENDDRADMPTRAYYNYKFRRVQHEEKVYIDD